MNAASPAAGDVPDPDSSGSDAPIRQAAPRSVRRSLASIVLGFETIVVFLAALVIWGLAPTEDGTWGLPPWVALAAGGVILLLLVLTIALLRYRWAYWLGWAIQAIVFAAGLLNPAMYVVGALFGGMWVYCMVAGSRIDREQAAAAAGKETT